jgi:nucleotidyltransferase/DNA polymerase involved in DNA repair
MPKKKKSKYLRRGKISKKEMVQVRMAGPISKELKGNAPVEAIKGIGAKKGKALRRKGISTVRELRRAKKEIRD